MVGRGSHRRGHAGFASLVKKLVAVAVLVSVVLAVAAAYSLLQESHRPPQTTGDDAAKVAQDVALSAWDELAAPNYYAVTGPAQLPSMPERGVVVYQPLDAYGRATGVLACVDYPLMEAGMARDRESMSSLTPSGWGENQEVDIELPGGGTYHGYFWNRSHLLAKSLGGEERLENLVRGTRMQNVGANVSGAEGGMAYAETLARDWLSAHRDGCVYYAATPVYIGAEPLCRCVVVDVLSSDKAIDCEAVVFNAAKGYSIDYATGQLAPIP